MTTFLNTISDSHSRISRLSDNSRFDTMIQPKLRVGRSDDEYEKEADAVADQVIRMPDRSLQMQSSLEEEEEQLQMQPKQTDLIQMRQQTPKLQGMCPRCRERARQGKPLNCPDCEKKLQMTPAIQRQDDGQNYASTKISNQLHASKGQGAPLQPGVQQAMTHKMGSDFSGVNIHTDSKSQQLNRQLGARAFTYGNDIYFNKGEYNPKSQDGKRLLAHELTHVVQQSSFSDNLQIQRACMNGTWQTEYDGCSVPPKVATMIGAAHKDNPSGGSDTHFALPDSTRNRPCDRHDECYQTCHNDPNAKLMCDWQMYDDMMEVCRNSRENEEIKKQCRKYAWIYLNGLMDAGTIAFLSRQQQVCSCEGGGLGAEEHLSGFQFPLGLTLPIGENAMLNVGAGTYRPATPPGLDESSESSFAAGGQFIWRF